ncbi:hypothetical protein [Rhizohabitans arisaemae]|nr:hypothetical protein [Rhizohabitans arisaemae]
MIWQGYCVFPDATCEARIDHRVVSQAEVIATDGPPPPDSGTGGGR